MFGFLTRQDSDKEIALPFKVVLEEKEDGFFVATVPSLPGCIARGRSKSEALRNVEEAVRLHLDAADAAPFEVVSEDPSQRVVHCITPFFGRLVAATNRDGSFASSSGDYGAWSKGEVSKAGAAADGSFSLKRERSNSQEEAEAEGLVDFTPQVYCLSAFSGTGVPKLYAGTSTAGSIYESVDGVNWELSTATGEDRVHCLAEFRNRLYAGTSGAGKLFCYTGTHWSLVHRSSETAITAAASFRGELFLGTYPNGHIYASADGLNWHLAYDSGQTFVRSLVEFDGVLYAATSKASGGMVLRSVDGLRWEKVFETRDPNFYCLQVFSHALWLGTGNNGRLYRSLDGSAWTLAGSLEDEGIRGLAAYDGRLYLATEGRGRIYRSTFADTPPPSLTHIRVDDVTSHSAVVSWSSDRPSDSRVLYGPGPTDAQGLKAAAESGRGSQFLTDSVHASNAVTEHRLALSYLKSHTPYVFQVVSRCPDGSEAGFSETLTFTTGGAETAEIHSPTHPDEEAWSRRNDALFSWSVPEGVVRFTWCLDSLPGTLPVEGQDGVRSTTERGARVEDLKDGVWWFHLRCEDRAGNLGAAASHYRLRIDTVALPPRVSSATHAEGAWSNKPKAVFSWEAPADPSGIVGYYVLLDRKRSSVPNAETGAWSAEPRFALDLPEDGEWCFHVVSVDAAGNIGTEAAHYSVKLDRRADPPTVESPSHPDPLRWFNTSQVQLTWTPPQDLSGITGYYTLLDQRPESVPTPHSGTFTLGQGAAYTGKGDGVWWFHIVSADAAGNIGTEAAHRCVRIDTWAAPPEISSPTHPAGTWVSSGRVVVELVPPQDLSGTVGYYYIVDKDRLSVPSAEKGTYTGERTLEFSGLSDGMWYVHVVSKDAAGNVGVEAAHLAVRIDTEARPPLLNSTTHPAADEWSRARQAEMVWDAPEDLSGVASYYWILDQEPDTVPTAHSGVRCSETRARAEMPEDGVWWFHVVSADRAGNVGRVASHYRLKVDTQALPPRLLCPTHPDRAAWSNHTRPRFEWFEPEDSSGVVGYYWCFDRNDATVPNPATAYYTTERYAVVDRGIEGDGVWWFHVASRDRAGNVGVEASHWPVRIDTTALPPALGSPTHPDRHGWSNNPNPVFEWAAPEDASGVAGYYFILNRSQASIPSETNGTWTEEPRAAFAGLEDGVWTLHVVSKDRCGNVGTQAAHYSIRLDTQALPPQVSSPSHPEGAWTRNATPTFVWTPPSDAAGVAGYYHCLDHEPATVPTKEKAQFTTGTLATFPRLDDGVWVFHIVTADAAGNVGNRASHYSIHIDTSAGAARVSCASHPDPEQWYRNANPTLSWAAPPDPSGISGYYWALDQSPETVPGQHSHWTAENQATPGPLPDGEWWFHICTKDGAGNVSAEAAHFRLRIDTQAPKPRLFSKSHPDPEQWGCQERPSFVWDDGDDLSGIAGHYWIFDRNSAAPVVPGQANWTTAGSVTLSPQKDGVWTFALVAKDKAGNLSEPARLSVRIETQPPVSRMEPLPQLTGRQSFEVRWKGEDRVSGVAHYDVQVRETEDGEWKTWMSETTAQVAVYTGRDGVDVQFRVRATDRAGNAEAFPQDGPFVGTLVDLSPPEPVVNLDAKPGPAGSISLNWSPSSDSGSGLAGYEVWRSPSSHEAGACVSPAGGVAKTSFTDPGRDLEDGALYYYTVQPFDKAGNKAKEGNQRVSCICDKTALPPVLASPSHPDPQEWSRTTRAHVLWEHPADATGMAGYYWSVDQSQSSVPNPRSAQFTDKPELELDGLKDGTWHVHVVSKDLAGNVSEQAGHYQINIDTTPPPAPAVHCMTHPNPEAWSSETAAVFQWSVPPDPARIAGYHWALDRAPMTVPAAGSGQYTPSTTAEVRNLDDGVWYFHVTAVDRAGNQGREAGHCRIQVTHSPPPPKVSSPTHPRSTETYGGRTAVFHWASPAYNGAITGWHYCLDQSPDTVPDGRNPRTTELRAEFTSIAAGDWWFHIASVDSEGRHGSLAEHFHVRVRAFSSLQGQVTKPNGMLPLEGAGLELFRQGKSEAKTTTGKDGRFRFDELEPGELLVKLDVQGQPPLLIEGVRLDGSNATLNPSAECMAWPTPTAGAAQVRFAVLAKEAGSVGIKLYTENGQALGVLEGKAARPGYVKLAWDCSQAQPGTMLWQATVTAADGKAVKYPIRKLQVSK
jgi:predicted RNase H-like HicB family nuclease